MRNFLKGRRCGEGIQNAALAVRLATIADRGRIDVACDAKSDIPEETIKRRFWTPDEVAAQRAAKKLK